MRRNRTSVTAAACGNLGVDAEAVVEPIADQTRTVPAAFAVTA